MFSYEPNGHGAISSVGIIASQSVKITRNGGLYGLDTDGRISNCKHHSPIGILEHMIGTMSVLTNIPARGGEPDCRGIGIMTEPDRLSPISAGQREKPLRPLLESGSYRREYGLTDNQKI